MALPLYLALTAAEFQNCSSRPDHMAWMACHYSPYGLGLSNCPRALPEGTMLILNDRTPPSGHDPQLIGQQLAELVSTLQCGSVLLDFQRPDSAENAAVVKAVTAALPCPVGVSELYARDLTCPVFLPPVPPHIPLGEYLSPWQGREVWLEAALSGEVITVTETGSICYALSPGEQPECTMADPQLHCHYSIRVDDKQIVFTLQRTNKDAQALLSEAEKYHVTTAVGLWQELN